MKRLRIVKQAIADFNISGPDIDDARLISDRRRNPASVLDVQRNACICRVYETVYEKVHPEWSRRRRKSLSKRVDLEVHQKSAIKNAAADHLVCEPWSLVIALAGSARRGHLPREAPPPCLRPNRRRHSDNLPGVSSFRITSDPLFELEILSSECARLRTVFNRLLRSFFMITHFRRTANGFLAVFFVRARTTSDARRLQRVQSLE